MRRGILFLLTTLFIFIAFHLVYAQQTTGDGIPDNCERPNATYYQANVFPRYEAQNSRVVLVDWTTGGDVRELETGLVTGGFQVRGWSPDCHYLVGAIGASDDMDTVVWDALNGGRVGTVENAVGRPHYIAWSPNSQYLMVETRHGGVLWEIATNRQVVLTEDWDGYSLRNFVRYYWGDGQITFTPVDSPSQVFDFNTWQIRPLPEIRLASLCSPYNYASVNYNRSERQIEIVYGGTTQFVIESNIDLVDLRVFGRSSDCRYYAAALEVDNDLWETVIWDIATSARVAVFPDAHYIPHGFSWSPIGNYALIQTRNGGYLWDVPNDTRTLLTDGVESVSNYYSPTTIRNFRNFRWDTVRGQLWTVNVITPNAVTVYDVYTGAQVAFYATHYTGTVQYLLSDDNNFMVVYASTSNYNEPEHGFSLTVFNLSDGSNVRLITSLLAGSYTTLISPDNRYLVLVDTNFRASDEMYVWDLHSLHADGTANYINPVLHFESWRLDFVSPTILQSASNRQWNILTGELIYTPVEFVAQPITSQQAQTTGYGYAAYNGCSSHNSTYTRRGLFTRYDGIDDTRVWLASYTTGENLVLLADAEYRASLGTWSADCRYIYVYSDSQTVLWDTVNLTQMQTPFPELRFYNWSPDGERVLINGGSPDYTFYIWQPTNGNLVALTPTYGSLGSMGRTYWDYERGQLLIGVGGDYRVWVFDMVTGQQRYEFIGSTIDNGHRNWRGYFFVSGEWLFIQGSYGLTFFNLNTLENQMVVSGSDNVHQGRTIISPDGRYLVAFGWTIRVWDLTTLSSDVDERLPQIYGGPEGYIVSLQFVDSATVEVTTPSGAISRWDVTTGTRLSD
jgi:hypothetical protein